MDFTYIKLKILLKAELTQSKTSKCKRQTPNRKNNNNKKLQLVSSHMWNIDPIQIEQHYEKTGHTKERSHMRGGM
jgi:hypothetical protein